MAGINGARSGSNTSQNRSERMEDVKSSAEAVSVDRKRSCRLYPSLPKVDRHEADSDTTLAAQILILEEQKKELLLINEKWAREYRTMKQFYSKKVRELRSILQGDFSHTEDNRCEEGEKNITFGKKVQDEDSAKAEVSRSGDEAAELRGQNSFLTRRGQHQMQEIRRLNEALQVVLGSDDVRRASLQDVWKHQAEVYREDFLKERSDREKLHGRYLDLEEKYRKVCYELRALKPQAPPTKPIVDCRCRNHGRSRNPTEQPTHRPTHALNFTHH
ncbi:TNFAIP3-interacting protein 3-like isoform X2 [Takifugu rubripes]|uniref:TNFAIP3-interacting protein 3-like isoform X2 n=1 Tax=Takifugu rubripes TaxID=31033 RepID=UPI001145DEFD|nr:TNFAIP3-interacting protein 3-like isoform X2 [Takifugu rubripes]